VFGPLLGAAIGVGFETLLKGRPTRAGSSAAQGILGVDESEITAAKR
jgi:aquaporin Z